MHPTVRLAGVTRSFQQVTAVADVDLELRPGTLYGLVGPNGAGKTTTLRTILGLHKPDRGTVELFGGPPNDSRRARIGYVPEARSLPHDAVVHDTLAFFAQMRGFSRRDALARASAWLHKLELDDKREAVISTLSNGQQQMVQIALALVCEPELILLDEPLTALDPNRQEIVSRRLREACSGGATVLVCTHRLHEAETFIDHVVMLSGGRKVLDHPLHDALSEAAEGSWEVQVVGGGAWLEGPDVASLHEVKPSTWRLTLRPEATLAALLARGAAAGAPIRSVRQVVPSLHELYLTRARSLTGEGQP